VCCGEHGFHWGRRKRSTSIGIGRYWLHLRKRATSEISHSTETMIRNERGHDGGRYHPARRSALNRAFCIQVCPWLLVAILLQSAPLSAEPIRVRYPEGTTHGFLALRTLEGKLLASGELTEVLHGK
jgi:hypothetical protein